MKNICKIIVMSTALIQMRGGVRAGEYPEVVGPLDDGKEQGSIPESSPSYRVYSSVTKANAKREITLNLVEPPSFASKAGRDDFKNPQKTGDTEQSQNSSFIVEASAFPGNLTRVRWWPSEGPGAIVHECWSNADWKTLAGFHQFKFGSRSFTFMLLTGPGDRGREETGRVIPPKLPDSASGARYMLVAGDESDDSAMDFIEGLPEIHDVEKVRLQEALIGREERQRQRKSQDSAELRVNKIEVNFGPLTPDQKAR